MQLRNAVRAAAVATLFALPAFSQTNFQYQSYPTPNSNGGTIQAQNVQLNSFNGNALGDVLLNDSAGESQTSCGSPGCLWLYMTSTDGEAAPKMLPAGLGDATEKQTAVADFNGDGKLDIAAIDASGGVEILYGNGDGTFKAPVYIAIQSNDALTSVVTADFDVNGTPDLGVLSQDGVLWLLYNDGKGNFTQQGVPIDSQPAGYMTTSLVVGDFNADGRPDVAWVEQGNADNQDNTVYTALNTSKGIFSTKAKLTTTVPGTGDLLSADLDLDGKSDLIVWSREVGTCCTNYPVNAYYSNGSGTFTAKTVATTVASTVAVTDINGDADRDVLIGNTSGVEVYTGNGNRTFTSQGTYSSMPGGVWQLATGFVDTSNRMGFAAMESAATGNNDLYVASNDNAQGDCTYPTSAGAAFCQAVQNGDSVLVRGTARAAVAPVERIELWANGKKLYQVFADEFNATLNVAPGTAITAVEVEANGTTKSKSVTPTSQQTCDAPSSPGVNVCAPTPGENTTSPVLFSAAGRGASGTVNHLELWIDGNKIGNYSGSTMEASIAVSTGSHSAQVVEVDSTGAYAKSAVVNFTVGGQTGPCSAPSSPGVHVCEPTQGESSASPVSFLAAGTGASGSVNHLELWIDGNKVGNYSGGDLETSVSEPAGSHTATVIEVDSKGAYVKSSPVSYTVK